MRSHAARPDLDGDGVGALDDVCPTIPASTANGCPTVVDPPDPPDDPTGDPLTIKPTPTPPPGSATRILALRAVVTPHSCPKAHPKCSKAAKVTVKLSRRATVALKLEMKVKRKGRWVWTRLTSKSVTATASGRSLTIRGKHGRSLAKGSYRMVASLSGSSAKTVFSFRV